MSREIKFRGWDKKKKGMLENALKLLNDGLITTMLEDSEDLVWMQYIGFKDRNGADIYEGDIVIDIFGGISVVTWCSDSASFYCKYSNDGLGMDEFGSLLEVIGNIYENPELMEQFL